MMYEHDLAEESAKARTTLDRAGARVSVTPPVAAAHAPGERRLGLGDDLAHDVAGGIQLVDRADALPRRVALAVRVDAACSRRRRGASSPPATALPICSGNGSSSSGCSSKYCVDSLRTARSVLPVNPRLITVSSSSRAEQRVLVARRRRAPRASR